MIRNSCTIYILPHFGACWRGAGNIGSGYRFSPLLSAPLSSGERVKGETPLPYSVLGKLNNQTLYFYFWGRGSR